MALAAAASLRDSGCRTRTATSFRTTATSSTCTSSGTWTAYYYYYYYSHVRVRRAPGPQSRVVCQKLGHRRTYPRGHQHARSPVLPYFGDCGCDPELGSRTSGTFILMHCYGRSHSMLREPPEAPKGVEPRNTMVPAAPSVLRDEPTTPRPSRVAGSSSQPQSVAPIRIRNPDPSALPSSPQEPASRTPAQKAVLATPIRQPSPRRQPTPATSPSPSPPPSSPSPSPSSPPGPQTPSPPQRLSGECFATPVVVIANGCRLLAGITAGRRRLPGIKQDLFADLTVLQRAILLQLMNAPPSELGTHVSAIAMGVSHHNMNSDQVG